MAATALHASAAGPVHFPAAVGDPPLEPFEVGVQVGDRVVADGRAMFADFGPLRQTVDRPRALAGEPRLDILQRTLQARVQERRPGGRFETLALDFHCFALRT